MSPDTTPKKLARRTPSQPSALTAAEESTFAFAKDVLKQAVALVDAVIAEVAFEGLRDPKAVGLVLLCRSISNFQGALTMARDNQAVESRTLTRSCVEDLFLVDQLCKHGAGFVKDMRSHEEASRQTVAHSALKLPGVADGPKGRIVRDQIKRGRNEFPKPKKLTVSETAEGELEKMYPAYAMLAHDAAHASVTALRRHSRPDHKGQLTVHLVPPFKPGERLETLDSACETLLRVCIGVNELAEGTSQSDAIRALWERFVGWPRGG
jgi:hypothetical protein